MKGAPGRPAAGNRRFPVGKRPPMPHSRGCIPEAPSTCRCRSLQTQAKNQHPARCTVCDRQRSQTDDRQRSTAKIETSKSTSRTSEEIFGGKCLSVVVFSSRLLVSGRLISRWHYVSSAHTDASLIDKEISWDVFFSRNSVEIWSKCLDTVGTVPSPPN
jgi:hypothetical protein